MSRASDVAHRDRAHARSRGGGGEIELDAAIEMNADRRFVFVESLSPSDDRGRDIAAIDPRAEVTFLVGDSFVAARRCDLWV